MSNSTSNTMSNPMLIVYDNTGRVWATHHGETSVPAGVQGLIADAPQFFKSVYVDVAKHEAVFDIVPDTESEVTNLQDALIELEERVSALEG